MKCGECKYSTLRIEVERAGGREWPRHAGVIVRKAEILECGRKEQLEISSLDSVPIKEILEFEPRKDSECIYEKIEKQREALEKINRKGG